MTPRGCFKRAALIAIVYALLHVCGGRAQMGFLSGTPVDSVWLGCAYLVFHFLFVIVAPILLLAGGLLWAMRRGLPSPTDGPKTHRRGAAATSGTQASQAALP